MAIQQQHYRIIKLFDAYRYRATRAATIGPFFLRRWRTETLPTQISIFDAPDKSQFSGSQTSKSSGFSRYFPAEIDFCRARQSYLVT